MISFQDVKKRFDSNVVLDGFSLDVHDGETMVILGYSGTGKSVALKHIVGLLEPDSGQVEVDEQIVHMLDPGRVDSTPVQRRVRLPILGALRFHDRN